ncbi:MAG TPA: hypothetical protein VJ385_03490 [Fibrobacteria bacterium]|nr:hypothetical protein [Fibrobacteria bacterium]
MAQTKKRSKPVDDAAVIAAFAKAGAGKKIRALKMRDVAKQAGLDEISLRARFPSRQSLFSAYLAEKADRIEADMARIKDFDAYPLLDKLQTLLETEFRVFGKDRDFLRGLSRRDLFAPFPGSEHPLKDMYLETAAGFVRAARRPGRDRRGLLDRAAEEALWIHHNAVFSFWLGDESARGDATSELIDKSLRLLVPALESEMLRHAGELLRFLFGSRFKEPIATLATAVKALDLARAFGMGGARAKKA